MKRILLFTALLAALTGCTESAEVEGVISLSLHRIEAPATGQEKTLTVQSKCDWTAECDATWITISQTGGDAGKSEMKITIQPNGQTERRTTQIRIGNDDYGISESVAVSQEAFAPNISVSQDELGCDSEGKTFEVSIQASIPWNASSEADWITFSPRTSETAGNAKMSVTVAANNATDSRKGEIVLRNEQYDIRKTIKVVQSNFNPKIEPDTERAVFGHEADSMKIGVRANVPWQASCDAEWVCVEIADDALWIKADASFSTEDREAQVVLNNEPYGLQREITVVQNAAKPFLKIDKTQMEMLADFSLETNVRNSNTLVRISSNIPWSASSDAAWARPALSEHENGETELRIFAENNYSDRAREAKITFRNEKYGISHSVTVVQQAPRLRFLTDDRNISVGPEQQTLTFVLEYNITYISSLNMWPGVQIKNDNSHSTMTNTINIDIPPGNDDQPKTGFIGVRNADFYYKYEMVDRIYITQQPRKD